MGDKLDRVKFAKVCEMMTSPHDGERLSATARANDMLKAAGMTWTEALKPVSPVPRAEARQQRASNPYEQYGATNEWMNKAREAMRRPQSRKPQKYGGWAPKDFEYRDLAKMLFEHECLSELDDKHQDFISDMAVNETRTFTEAQRKYLDNLAKQLDRRLRTRQHTY